tara:strand:- start:383 stop:1183 length:801 start_codon:yes stop_codon:yes gene_type:complete
MSSIYKKGRDGYYYYQTYVYNSDTKKKDKRIFHALRTKSFGEAQKKQQALDLRYEKEKSSRSNFLKSNKILLSASLVIVSFITLISLSIFNSNYEIRKTKISKNDSEVISENRINDSNIILQEELNKDDLRNKQSKTNVANDKVYKNGINQLQDFEKIEIPYFTIERVEKISDAFHQGKIFVTIDKKSNNQSLRLLCDSLKQQFSQFSNIVICLYSDDNIGKNLANGNDLGISMKEKQDSWLAMFTFNSVEGSFFDSNPNGYRGIQ